MGSIHSWKDGQWDLMLNWRADMVWKMRRRIFNTRVGMGSAEMFNQWHRWIDDFCAQTDAPRHGQGVPDTPQHMDHGGSADHEQG